MTTRCNTSTTDDSEYPVLRCEGLCKRFGGVWALADVTVAVMPGEIVGVVGPNGAGKTTLIDVITGMVIPDRGRVRYGGKNIAGAAPHQILRSGIARTFQELRLIRLMSVVDNVMLAADERRDLSLFRTLAWHGPGLVERQLRERAMEQLRTVGLIEQAESPASALSYGQQKLLTLACALATDAHLVLLDEPVSGLDPNMADQVAILMSSIAASGRTVVFVEHDFNAVRRVAKRVLAMDIGQIIADGPPSSTLELPRVLESFID